MPIARINPDGTVKIYNSKTGETKDVAPEELGRYNPKLVGEYYKLTGEGVDPTEELKNTKAKKELEAIKSGTVTGVGGDEGTATERALAKKAQVGLDALSRIEASVGQDPNVIAKQRVPGQLGVRAYDADISSIIDVIGNLRTGATITPQQQKLYERMLPKIGDSPEESAGKIASIRAELQRYAPGATNTTPTPQSNQFPPESIVPGQQPGMAVQVAQQRQQQQMNPLEKLLNPVAQGPIGAGVEGLMSILMPDYRKAIQTSAKGGQVSLDQGVGAGGDILSTVLPIGKVGKLGLAAKGALAGGVSGVTGANQTAYERAKAGLLQGALGGVLGGIPQVGKAAKRRLNLNDIGNRRQAAVEAGKDILASGDDLIKAGDEYVQHDPLAKSVWNKIKPKIG